jgi:ssRNA-specific RNase YbeY (16S rRNA maturation enzyme)
LLLYVIHGCLHLAGHDDQTAEGLAKIRAAETEHLARFGLTHRYDQP